MIQRVMRVGLCLGALAALAATLVSPVMRVPAAMAQTQPRSSVVLVDSTNDVWKFFPGEDPGMFIGARPTVDITRARAAHLTWAVSTRVRFVDLKVRPNPQTVQVVIRTDDTSYVGFLTMGPGRRSGTHQMYRTSGAPVLCPAMTHLVDYDDDLVVLRIPRSCLGRPVWARLKIESIMDMPGTTTTSPYSFVDNPHNDGPHALFTPRLYRG